MDKNNTNFPTQLQELLDQALKTSKLSDKLFYYQKLAVTYAELVAKKEIQGVKGLVIWHQMGLGKTMLSIAIADVLSSQGYKVKIITPKSLQQNFKDGVDKYNAVMPDANLDKNSFSFLVRSRTIMRQLAEGNDNISLMKVFQDDRNDIILTKIEENTVLIIDEYHQISQLIANGSATWIRFYDAVMRSPNVITIMLTGSLYSSSPFELSPTFNMASGLYLFPEREDDFMKLFWDDENQVMRNVGQFQNRCMGLISRMKLSYLESDTKNLYPAEHETQVIRCPMTSSQLESYITARQREVKESKINSDRLSRPSAKRFESDSRGSSTYRVYSRQYSNFGAIPELIELQKQGEVSESQIISIVKKSPDEYFHNGKFEECYKITTRHSGRKGLIISQFTSVGGALSIAEGYLRRGYKEVRADGKYEPGLNFAIVNGSLTIEEQAKILELFYSEENDDGSIIHFVIGGLQQALGLDVKSGVFAILYEPYWVYMVWDQLKKRINRYESHIRLPVEERETFPYILLSVYPDNIDPKIANAYGMKITTDEHLYNLMIRDKEQSKQFKKPLEQIAIDCPMVKRNFPDKICKICNPNNRKLYTYGKHNPLEVLQYDCDQPDPCQTETEEVKAEKVKIGGETLYKVADATEPGGFAFYRKLDGPDPVYEKVIHKK